MNLISIIPYISYKCYELTNLKLLSTRNIDNFPYSLPHNKYLLSGENLIIAISLLIKPNKPYLFLSNTKKVFILTFFFRKIIYIVF